MGPAGWKVTRAIVNERRKSLVVTWGRLAILVDGISGGGFPVLYILFQERG